MKVLLENYAHSGSYSEDSFLGIFHEKDIWDEQKYWELEKDIVDAIPLHQEDTIPRDIAVAVVHVTGYIMATIQAHFAKNDGWTMDLLSDDVLFDYYERMRVLQSWFFEGQIEDLNLVSDIQNPLL